MLRPAHPRRIRADRTGDKQDRNLALRRGSSPAPNGMAARGAMDSPSANDILIELLGAAALLLWGLRMVRTGVLRSFGAELRHFLRVSLRNRFAAFLAGLAVTGILQSSTATALVVASFAGRGLVATAPALAVMLGADVGTSLVAQVLSLDIHWLAPLLILLGVSLHLGACVLDLSRARAGGGRPGPDASGPAAAAGGIGADARGADRQGAVGRAHRRAVDRHPGRRAPDLARPFQPGDRAADHVARRAPTSCRSPAPACWSSAPTSAAPSRR